MSSNFNNAKIINVYYTKGDRKPYDVNGKPIAYIGEEYIGANEATELRFHFGEELDSASAIIVAKRANGDTRLDPLELVGTGVNSYFKVTLNAWYAEYKGKMTIIFKVYNGTVTYDDPETPTQIVSTTGQIIVSDIFNLEVAYAPNASSLVPPFETEDYDDWFFTLSTKLDKAQSITVVGALPTLTGGVYDDRYFYVEDEGVGRLYYINGSTAIECVWGIGQVNFATTNVPSSALTVGQMRYNDTTGSLDLGLKGNHILKVGETVIKRVRNDEAVNLKVGQMVYVSGAVGNSGLLLVKKADNIGDPTSSKTFGMVATAMNTTSAKDGYVYIYGLLQGIDLTDTDVAESVFSAGDVGSALWLGASGKIRKTIPTGDTQHSVFIGYLDTYGGAGSNCSIYVKIQNGYELSELHDVRVSAIADNQILRYNSTRQVWENTNELTTAESNIANLQGRMTTEEANVDNLQGRMTTAETDITNIENGTTIVGKALADQNGNVINTTYLTQSSASATYIPLSQKGANNGVVPLNSNGKISSIYLSGEQDDYIEFANLASFPLVGEADIIYCAIDTGLIYRWTGSTYAVISPSLALGTTATTAYAGDKGLALEGIVNTANQVDTGIVKWNATTGRFESSNTLVQTSGGNVGIGTSTPSQTLEIQSLNQATTNNGNALINTSDAVGINVGGMLGLGGRFAPSAFTSFGTISGRKDTATAGESAGYLAFATRGTSALAERMRITSIGRVGIGTTAPDQLLHVAGAINLHSQITWFNGNADINGADTNLKFRTYNGTALTEYMRLTSAGRLGIGTTSPSYTFHVKNTDTSTTIGANIVARFETNASNADVSLQLSDGVSSASQISHTAGALHLRTANTTRLSVLSDGNVGIGTASPGTRLDVNGSTTLGSSTFGVGHTVTINSSTGGIGWLDLVNSASVAGALGRGNGIRFSSASGNIGSIRVETIDANNSGKLFFNTVNAGTDTTKMTILPNGNVGIGTSSPATTLSVITGSNADGIQIRRNSDTTNDFATLGFRILTTENQANLAEIRGVRTNRLASAETDLTFLTRTAGTLGERMRIRDDGNVGIGTTAPAVRLHVVGGTRITGVVSVMNDTEVKRVLIDYDDALDVGIITAIQDGVSYKNLVLNRDGANVGIGTTFPTATLQIKNDSTTKVPLIVDTVASHTADLQQWKINNTNISRVDSTGYFAGVGIYHITSANNALIVTDSSGTTIRRNVADTNPALIVNLANASATGNIEVWQKAGSAVAFVSNNGSISSSNSFYNGGNGEANGRLTFYSGGPEINRNVADANTTLKVKQTNVSATGRLQEWITGSDVVSSVEKDGIANFTGTPSNAQTVDYTLVLADKGKVVRINSSSNLTVTIPLNSSVAFPIDTEIAILRYGTGTVSISPTSGVTLNSKNSERKISGQYGSVALKKIGTDEWVLVGSLEA